MRGLSIHNPTTTLCTFSTPSTLLQKLSSLFKRRGSRSYRRHHNSFNSDTNTKQSQHNVYPPEKPYHHIPTHAASSHLKTTTTRRMREIEADIQEQVELDQRMGADSRIGPIVTDGSWGDRRGLP